MNNQLLREIPKVDELLRSSTLARFCGEMPRTVLADAVRAELDSLRKEILSGGVDALPEEEVLCRRIRRRAESMLRHSLRRVINATGVVLHTNLGRAPISVRAAKAAADVAMGYSTLEYDVEKGARGERYSHVESLLTRLTGAESAFVVNNNAAAVLIILSALTAGGEVVTSRGELVEIGGSFRVPEIMESCGARLREVGTTNKTHLADYARAIGPETRALMKVHTSNYRIVGFTESVSREEMVSLAHENGLLAIEDLGSGSLYDLNNFGLRDEPTVQESVRSGMDVISFSGDKLLGGPQAGIIIGKKQYIDILKHHPLTRAMRVDKMTLAALEATLRSYAEETAVSDIPALAMLSASPEVLRGRAEKLTALMQEKGIPCAVREAEDQVGGGSVPMQLLPSFAVAVIPEDRSVDALEEALRRGETAVIGRIGGGEYLLHVRTLCDAELPLLAAAVAEVLR